MAAMADAQAGMDNLTDFLILVLANILDLQNPNNFLLHQCIVVET
jgi:hypothetical protein